jgi:hypothetical protein
MITRLGIENATFPISIGVLTENVFIFDSPQSEFISVQLLSVSVLAYEIEFFGKGGVIP